jgi:hypothetical protein
MTLKKLPYNAQLELDLPNFVSIQTSMTCEKLLARGKKINTHSHFGTLKHM